MNVTDYVKRINTVIDFINANLSSDLSLKKLAVIAHFSPFYFHRVFRMITGENVSNYVKRLRLEKAAIQLLYTCTPISEIAMESGFTSFSTFSRAFKDFYKESPSHYRNQRNSKIGKMIRKEGTDFSPPLVYDHDSEVHSQKQGRGSVFHMQVDVKDFPQYRVAYIRHVGFEKGEHNQAITDAFERVSSWVGMNEHYTKDMKVMAVIHDHPDFTPQENRRYDAAFTVHEHVNSGTGEIGIQDIPMGKYAVARISVNNNTSDSFAMAMSEVWNAFDYLHNTWLPGGGFQLDKRPYLEIYVTGPSDPILTIDVCIPVKS